MNSLGFRVVAMLFRKLTGTQFTIVPYRAASDLVADVMADRIDLNFGTLPSALTLMRAGSVKLYAVTSDRRSALAPDIPTFAEMGLPAMTYSSWYGIFTPKGTPKDFMTVFYWAQDPLAIQNCGPVSLARRGLDGVVALDYLLSPGLSDGAIDR